MTHQPLSVFFPSLFGCQAYLKHLKFFMLSCHDVLIFSFYFARRGSNITWLQTTSSRKKKKNLTAERNVNLQTGIKITGVLRKEKRHTCRYLMENPSAYSLVDKSTNEAKVTQNMLRGQRFRFKASLLRHILEKSMREDFFPTSSASLTRLICSR